MEKIIASGKRKRAVARAILMKGSGKVTINKKNYEFFQLFDKLKIQEPLRIAKEILGKIDFDIFISARGGGEKGQVEAARLALARAIVKFSKSMAESKDFSKEKPKELEEAYFDYDKTLVVADIRRKEPNKPGDSKARSKRQSSKR